MVAENTVQIKLITTDETVFVTQEQVKTKEVERFIGYLNRIRIKGQSVFHHGLVHFQRMSGKGSSGRNYTVRRHRVGLKWMLSLRSGIYEVLLHNSSR